MVALSDNGSADLTAAMSVGWLEMRLAAWWDNMTAEQKAVHLDET